MDVAGDELRARGRHDRVPGPDLRPGPPHPRVAAAGAPATRPAGRASPAQRSHRHRLPAVAARARRAHGSRVSSPEETYRRATPRSRELHERAVAVMPGGTTRTTTYFPPYPLYTERGH